MIAAVIYLAGVGVVWAFALCQLIHTQNENWGAVAASAEGVGPGGDGWPGGPVRRAVAGVAGRRGLASRKTPLCVMALLHPFAA